MAKKKSTAQSKASKSTKTSGLKKSAKVAKSDEQINPKDGIIPLPVPKKDCEQIRKEVDGSLIKKCTSKVNKLSNCNRCVIKDKDRVVLNSPFDAHLLNTGHDGAGGIIGSGTGNDLHWETGVGSASGGWASVSSWIPAYVYRSSAWVASPYSNANWISVFSDSDHSSTSKLDVYFRNKFYLNSSIDPNQFFLDMRFYADNAVHEIYVNGIPQSGNYPGSLPQAPTSPYNHVGFKTGKEVRISLAHNWRECENEIIVHVKSGSPKIGFLAQNASKCYEAKLPDLAPSVKITWGDSDCDCLETNDFEVMCITVCNPYSNVTFTNMKIGRIRVVDANGKPIANLPDGTPSVELLPLGPYCFGDIHPCTDDPKGSSNNCVTREFVIRTRGALSGKYKLLVEGICFDVCHHFQVEECFELNLCKD